MVFDSVPWIWLGVMLLCFIIEGLTTALTSIWFGIAALIMVFLSMLPIPIFVQILIFALLSLAMFALARPFFAKFLKVKKTPTNSDALVGKTAIVTEDIGATQKGAVKVDGKVWSASIKSEDNPSDTLLKSGDSCIIKGIEGVTLIVARLKEQ